MFSSYFGKKEDKCDGSLAYSSFPSLGGEVHTVLSAAADEKEEILILGAFGCGAFGNDVAEVAEIFRGFLDGKYAGAFRKIMFAVLDKPTYEKMRNVLA